MKGKTSLFLSAFLLLIVSSCNSDDDSQQPDSNTGGGDSLDQMQAQTIEDITSGSSKIWHFSEITLSNSSVTDLNIANNFNTTDDEFVISVSNTNDVTLEWSEGHRINYNGTTSEETLLEYYQFPNTYTMSFLDDSSTDLTVPDASINFTVINNNLIQGTVTLTSGETISFSLIEKTVSAYLQPSTSTLSFTNLYTFESTGILQSPGMKSSWVDNSIFIGTREEFVINNIRPERIFKYNLDNANLTQIDFLNPDFVTKNLHIINDKLVVAAGQNINQYNIDLTDNPTTSSHGQLLTRFGSANSGDNIFIVGGVLGADADLNKIFKWDMQTQTMSEFGLIPEDRSGARATIVHDKLYVFGGSQTFFGDPEDTIFVVSLNDSSEVTTLSMTNPVNFTFVQRKENLIYLAGRKDIKDNTGTTIGREPVLGVFNTLDNIYQELQSNLSSTSGFDTIHGMTILDNKMYIIYGDFGVDVGSPNNLRQWDVMVSDLN
ncbi:MAG: hypothetical protein HRT68_00450 [Flavobacteriaceae bacterium]|nr:hypothetical protein [Flavobacteriaceae bacterium]